MHIGLYVRYLGARGGTEEYVRAVGQALLDRGHRLSLLYEERADLSGAEWARFARSVEQLERADAPPGERATGLRRFLRSRRPDVLFTHNVTFSPEMLAAAEAEAVPVVPFVHDFRPVCLRVSKVFPLSRKNCTRALGPGCLLHMCSVGPPRDGRPLTWNDLSGKLAEREVYARSGRVVVASRFMRGLLLRNGFAPERVVVNPLFSPAPPPEAPPPLPAHGSLLYLGQIQRFKGLPVLLDALRRLPGEIRLEVAGDGPWRARCEALARGYGVADRVRFHGWVQRGDLPRVMAGASVVVMPSTWNEPFGLAGVEAMAYARPVVAFDVGGVREWMVPGETGVCVERVDAAALARAVQELWSNPERGRRMGVQGRQRVRDHLSLDVHVDRLLAEFSSLPPVPEPREVPA